MEKLWSKAIEITVISAEDLTIYRKQPVKKNISITVKTDPSNSRSTGQVDSEGGTFATWKNERLEMDLPLHARSVTVEAYSGNRLVGAATIPVSDFSGGYLPENYLSFLSYRLRDANGAKNGIVNLSVKVKGSGDFGGAASCSRPWMGVPSIGDKVTGGGGIVTGIPVPY